MYGVFLRQQTHRTSFISVMIPHGAPSTTSSCFFFSCHQTWAVRVFFLFSGLSSGQWINSYTTLYTCLDSDNTPYTSSLKITPSPDVFNHMFLWIEHSCRIFYFLQVTFAVSAQAFWTNSGFFCASQLQKPLRFNLPPPPTVQLSSCSTLWWMRWKTAELRSFYLTDICASNVDFK